MIATAFHWVSPAPVIQLVRKVLPPNAPRTCQPHPAKSINFPNHSRGPTNNSQPRSSPTPSPPTGPVARNHLPFRPWLRLFRFSTQNSLNSTHSGAAATPLKTVNCPLSTVNSSSTPRRPHLSPIARSPLAHLVPIPTSRRADLYLARRPPRTPHDPSLTPPSAHLHPPRRPSPPHK